MRIEEIDWSNCEPGASEELLASVEARLGVRFPDDYRRFVMACQGGTPTNRMRVRYQGPRGHSAVTSLGVMLMIDPDAQESIVHAMELLSHDEQLPSGLIPFGEVGDGDLFAFKFDGGEPSVVLWLHAANEADAVVPIASSFTSFLQSLEARS